MNEALALAALYLYGAFLGLLAAGRCRRAAVGVAVLGLLLPFHVPSRVALVRGLVGLGAVAWLLRIIDLARADPRQRPETAWRPGPAQRVWHVLALYDTRSARRVPPSLDRRSLGRIAAYGAVVILGLHLSLGIAPRLPGAWHWLVRWLGAAVMAYSLVDAMAGAMHFSNRLLGVALPEVHRTPILSRSIQEFWSERWNRIVSAWLRRNCLLPLVRRGRPLLGLFSAFAASALLHAYFTRVALDTRQALLMGSFFLLQFPLVLAERRLKVTRWPALPARLWTIALLLATAPLFLEPYLSFFEPLLR